MEYALKLQTSHTRGTQVAKKDLLDSNFRLVTFVEYPKPAILVRSWLALPFWNPLNSPHNFYLWHIAIGATFVWTNAKSKKWLIFEF
jgi:hypothetical protein